MSKEIYTDIPRQIERGTTEYKEFLYSEETLRNLTTISQEFNLRVDRGIATIKRLNPGDQIGKYLQVASQVAPDVNRITDELIKQQVWKVDPSIVATMPVVGTGGQEEAQIQNTLEKLAKDPVVFEGKVGVLILINRPAGSEPDRTASLAVSKIKNLNLNALVLETEVPNETGYIDGPFSEDMATETNQVPIALLRDMLSIIAMKMWTRNLQLPTPILLQMDGDFEGLLRGSFQMISDRFSDPSTDFLQCTSDWDSHINPTKNNNSLWIGSELMRELPQILKRPLNNSLPLPVKLQIVYGEAIQRGIQVPQAERMEAIARKGGYGLNRIRHDELDQNVRMSALVNLNGVRTTEEIVFLWSNRRAIKSWNDYRQPPISQWQSAFSVQDPVRQEVVDMLENSVDEDKLTAINRTLERFPVPPTLPGVYVDFTQPIRQILQFYGINGQTGNTFIREKPGGLNYLQLTEL